MALIVNRNLDTLERQVGPDKITQIKKNIHESWKSIQLQTL
jgi:hypothetical protein